MDVLLVAFYNYKALGVRYLESALHKGGHRVTTVFFKGFNSQHPLPATGTELKLLCDIVGREKPGLIGLSAMSSMYMDTVSATMARLKEACDAPLVVGGAYATMFPEYFLDNGADFVIRADGEKAITGLADCLCSGEDYRSIPSLGYRDSTGNVINPIGGLADNIDEYGLPAIQCGNAYSIENNTVRSGDPQLLTRSYEVIASRGCPFTCSYCCCENLRRLLPKGTRGVRSRSVESVIEELKLAKKTLPKLSFMHFYDEIFPNVPGWVEQFAEAYKREINMPFTIWSHPKMVDPATLKMLKDAGLAEVIMGIQSGSEHIRRDVFHRYETTQDILDASRAMKEAGVFWVTFDFMLRHPFESLEDLKDTYRLVREMTGPFELQLHGLNFLPGTDIVDMAIQDGYFTKAEIEAVMYAPMEKQFDAYWNINSGPENRLWYQLIYCLQFSSLRKRTELYAVDPLRHAADIEHLYIKGQKIHQLRYYYKKGVIVMRSKLKVHA